MGDDKVIVENVNIPGQTSRVDASKYDAMKKALLAVLPDTTPGMTAAEMKKALLPHLPDDLFPQGKTSGWWMKCVQLDLEAKKLVARENSKPLRFYKL
ncbi:DUF6958 family protein [Ahrensia marina]|uniref:Uncharacterized protein n=1 Tax=Ahrensia marina TaxID=1514904 RepID=A0A0N0VLL5_9HYPH|nr:hypothetical protein [Ahrensia marina]KPB01494.1 hypothetical protein SU32_07880 [Ahrensia marina]